MTQTGHSQPYEPVRRPPGLTDEQWNKVLQRINHRPLTPDSTLKGAVSGYSPDDKTRDAEVAAFQANPDAPEAKFPLALVTSAVRAADALMPEALEQRVTQIAYHYLNGKKSPEIAKLLDLPVEVVREEVSKLDKARAVAYKDNPELAHAVTDVQFNVLNQSITLANDMLNVLGMIKEEMDVKHKKFQDYNNKTIYGVGNLSPEDLKELKDQGKGISPMLLQAYTQGIDSVGRQYDRIGELTGQLGKHALKGDNNLTQINNFVQFNNDKLNQLADLFMQSAGHSRSVLHEAPQPQTLDVTAQTTQQEVK